MGYKAFCDKCGKETKDNVVSNRLVINMDHWTVEIMVAHEGTWNQGVLCEDCLWKILHEGDIKRATTYVFPDKHEKGSTTSGEVLPASPTQRRGNRP